MMALVRGWVLVLGGTHEVDRSGAHRRGGVTGGGCVVQLAQPCHITTSAKLLASFEDAGIIGRMKKGIPIHDVNRLDSVGME